MNKKLRGTYVGWAVVLMFSLALSTPLSALANTRTHDITMSDRMTGNPWLDEEVPPLDKQQRQKIEKDADLVANALTFDKKEKKVGQDEKKVAKLDNDGQQLLKRLVTDINSGVIGIAVIEQDGSTTLYGNPKALEQTGSPDSSVKPVSANSSAIHPMNSVSADWQGVHIYVDPWWTGLLKDLNGWAIATVTGLIITALCSNGIGCLATGVVASFVWEFVIWRIVRPYLPDSFTIHAPWWGWVTVQPWKSGAWYNGRHFRSNLWT